MPFNTTICNTILNYYLGYGGGFVRGDKLYLALSTNDPEDDDGTFEELSGNGYARVLLLDRGENGSVWPRYMSTVSDRTIYNKKEIHFNKATADWPTVYGFAVFSATVDKETGVETDDGMIYYARVDDENGISVPKDGVALFDPGKLKISFATKDVTEPEESTES